MVDTKSIFVGTIIFFLCCGCAKQNPEIQYVEKTVFVEVPVIQKIEVEPIRKPIYYIRNINNSSSPTEVVEAYTNTIKELNSYIKKLEIVVEPLYKKVEK